MQNHETWLDNIRKDLPLNDPIAETERWTSPAFQVKFSQTALVEAQNNPNASFRMSAWGLSTELRQLLSDYRDDEIEKAIDWLIIQQNAYVAIMLEDVMVSKSENLGLPILDHIFVVIDAELFLPKGLRMMVTCITNIVQVDENNHLLDKFVAVVDPGEAHIYTLERRGISATRHNILKH